MRVIGVAGKKRSGKDTSARFIREIMPQLQSIAFADKLKEVCSVFFSVPIGEFYDDAMKEKFYEEWQMTVREMMMSMADAMKSRYGKYVWLRAVKQKHKEWEADGEYGMIITDLRFEYEADWIRSMGGKIVHVSNSRVDAQAGDHNSEKGILFISGDEAFLNEGNLDYLKTQCHTFAKIFKQIA